MSVNIQILLLDSDHVFLFKTVYSYIKLQNTQIQAQRRLQFKLFNKLL